MFRVLDEEKKKNQHAAHFHLRNRFRQFPKYESWIIYWDYSHAVLSNLEEIKNALQLDEMTRCGGDTSCCGWILLHINNKDKSPDATVPSQLTKPLWSPCKSNQTVLLDGLQHKSHQDPTVLERNHSVNWATFNSLPKPRYVIEGSHQYQQLLPLTMPSISILIKFDL